MDRATRPVEFVMFAVIMLIVLMVYATLVMALSWLLGLLVGTGLSFRDSVAGTAIFWLIREGWVQHGTERDRHMAER